MQGIMALVLFFISMLTFAALVHSKSKDPGRRFRFLHRPLFRKTAVVVSVLAFLLAVVVSPKADDGVQTEGKLTTAAVTVR
ncbi:hypothetical protein [Paenibacillus sp. UNC499MF]|uniref:hypothetical protein n=1 Tax=Paenibacillus sp. UNC499MF TaxID=1502751 RepID=UPI0008A042A6|nr:hypothetical protein [Paenibacillus sp. UNC499MF]SEG67969.1 hypothetical protein SAMN02799616_04214 [Paenibacillus sp. UNC499MF]